MANMQHKYIAQYTSSKQTFKRLTAQHATDFAPNNLHICWKTCRHV